MKINKIILNRENKVDIIDITDNEALSYELVLSETERIQISTKKAECFNIRSTTGKFEICPESANFIRIYVKSI